MNTPWARNRITTQLSLCCKKAHHVKPPYQQASAIPPGTLKTVTDDVWHGYMKNVLYSSLLPLLWICGKIKEINQKEPLIKKTKKTKGVFITGFVRFLTLSNNYLL